MDGDAGAVQAKFEGLLRRLVEVGVRLSRVEGRFQGVPHYSEIETWAHEIGQEVSQQLQMRQMGEVGAQQPRRGRCLRCSRPVEMKVVKRSLRSVDGLVEVPDMSCYFPSCRGSFFSLCGSRSGGTGAT
jgi:hypothetical protein